MKKLVLLLCFLMCQIASQAQTLNTDEALKLVEKNKFKLGLSKEEIAELKITDAYKSMGTDITLVYIQQTIKGIPVFNQIQTLAFKAEKLVSVAGTYLSNGESLVKQVPIFPSVYPNKAVEIACGSKKITVDHHLQATTIIPGRKLDFGKLKSTASNIIAELLWLPIENKNKLALVWQIDLAPTKTADHWLIRVDAHSGAVLDENNLTVYCNWDDNHSHQIDHGVSLKNLNQSPSEFDNSLWLGANEKASNAKVQYGPSIIQSASYRVIPFPAESPRHPGGSATLVNNPWNAAPGNATSLKWHSTGTIDYTQTRGNNVWAQEDGDGNNGAGIPVVSTTGSDPLSFDFTPDFTTSPSTTNPIPNQQFNVTNLFYWNNTIHDVMYQYGFDEVAGNFQVNNQGRGGLGNDAVLADAQDGSGTNNANFSTPADGGNGRMQMFLWNAIPTLTVNTPASIAGQYQAVESNFSTANKLATVGPKTGQVVYYNDQAAGTTHEGCIGQPTNSVLGKIALIDRGNCNFTVKVKNAQTAGAIAVIMVNNVSGAPITMGGTDNTITIPAVMVSINDGLTFKNQLGNNLNVTLGVGPSLDGDVDNGVVVHEYSHGTSNRLTGGPAQASCLANAEQMGEGWSDYYALMLTQDWANSNLSTGALSPRGIGTYVIGQTPLQPGIRTQKYCTDMDINNKVYASTIPAETHDLGEIWCATLWDMTWNIIQQTGNIAPSIYQVNSGAGNAIALKLVTEGMKLQPCSPGFIDGRNAILKADSLLFNGAYACAIKEAFRRRGMGEKASQGSSASVTDQIADYTPFVTIEKRTNKVQAQENEQVTFTTLVSSCSPVTGYTLRDTLPTNVTYILGGNYDAASRTVSFPINFDAGQVASFSYVVQVNTGSYFTPQTLFETEVPSTTIPTSLTAISSTANTWTVSSLQSASSPNALFTPNAGINSDQKLESVSSYPLGTGNATLQFNHYYETQDGVDGGVVEISNNNGSSWQDIQSLITHGYYNRTLNNLAGHPLSGRKAWSGASEQFIRTTINLSSFANQNIKFRFRFGSNASVAGNGWFVDDIKLERAPIINIRGNLFDNANSRISYSDTATHIVQVNTCTPVSINSTLNPVSICAGDQVNLSISATGTNPQYQWQVSTDGGVTFQNLTSATASQIDISPVNIAQNNNQYRVIVFNNCPSADTSNNMILTVLEPSIITTQPNGVSTCEGSNALFQAVVSGQTNVYQWQVSSNGGTSFSNIPGANSTSLNLASVNSSLSGNYYQLLVVGCGGDTLISNQVTLTVSNQTTITNQPNSVQACVGGNAAFMVMSNGSNLQYQWQVSTDGGSTYIPIVGATNAMYTINAVDPLQNQNKYRVVIVNSCGNTITSQAATLTVTASADFSSQPQSLRVCDSSIAEFQVGVTGTGYQIQWQMSVDGGASYQDVAGAIGLQLVIPIADMLMDGNKFRARLTSCDAIGIFSNEVTLTVVEPAVIRSYAVILGVCEGDTMQFAVNVSGTAVVYQWEISRDAGLTYTPIIGENAPNLVFNGVSDTLANNLYRLIISNECTPPTASNALVVSITTPASILTQPQPQQICFNGNARFQTQTLGSVIGYQWQKSTDGGLTFNDINGETASDLQINGVQQSENGNLYRVAVYGSCPRLPIYSEAASLQILNGSVVETQPNSFAGCVGENAIFRARIQGSQPTYQWQKSTNGGINFIDVNGANADTLLVSNITASMNEDQYRLSITDQPCGVVTNVAILQINPGPVVEVRASPYRLLLPGLSTTLQATATPASDSFYWFKDGALLGYAGSALVVGYGDRGNYKVNSRLGCTHNPATINIGDSTLTGKLVYPNPTTGKFIIRLTSTTNQKIGLTIYDDKGSKIMQQNMVQTTTSMPIEGDLTHLPAGVYAWILWDEKGNEIGSGKIIKL